jgi:SAM-dependent methyltransferase
VTASPGFDPAHFVALAAAEQASFWFRSRNALILWALRRYAPVGWSRFLEVGCGTGFVLREIRRAFPAATLAGTELFAEGLRYAADRVPDAELRQLDARAMTYEAAFDVAGVFDVLEHIDDDQAVLRGLHLALRPGGLLLLTVPQHMWLWSGQDVVAAHIRRYSANEIHARVRAAGFTIERSTSFVSLLLPALVAKRRGSGSAKIEDLRQPRPLDLALACVMAIERAGIRAGLSYPAGGSRLVAARRGA